MQFPQIEMDRARVEVQVCCLQAAALSRRSHCPLLPELRRGEWGNKRSFGFLPVIRKMAGDSPECQSGPFPVQFRARALSVGKRTSCGPHCST